MRELTVDFNRVIKDHLIRGNARHAGPGKVLNVGSIVVVDEKSGEFSGPA
jgi:hypothetical protein